MTVKVHPDWWKTLFDEMYLKTDARSVCDEDLSRREVEVIRELIPVEPGHRIADLCGGQGRHSMHLSGDGGGLCAVVDYSPHLVAIGRRYARQRGLPVFFIRGDARETGLTAGNFHHVLIMGNSLGYLPGEEDDGRILAEAFRLLRPGGFLLVDVADGEMVRERLTANAWHEVDDDLVVCRQREMVDGRVMAREMVFSRRRGLMRDQAYAIRTYLPHELTGLIREAGFIETVIHDDFSTHARGGDLGFMNMRVIVTARKPEAVRVQT